MAAILQDGIMHKVYNIKLVLYIEIYNLPLTSEIMFAKIKVLCGIISHEKYVFLETMGSCAVRRFLCTNDAFE